MKNTWPLPYNEIKLTGKKQLAFMLEKRMVASQDLAVKKCILRKLLKINLSICLLLITCNLLAQPAHIASNGIHITLDWKSATNISHPPFKSLVFTNGFQNYPPVNTNKYATNMTILSNGKWVFIVWWKPDCYTGTLETSNSKELNFWRPVSFKYNNYPTEPIWIQFMITEPNKFFRLRRNDYGIPIEVPHN